MTTTTDDSNPAGGPWYWYSDQTVPDAPAAKPEASERIPGHQRWLRAALIGGAVLAIGVLGAGLAIQWKATNDARDELASTTQQLADSRSESAANKADADAVRSELTTTKDDLAGAQDEVTGIDKALARLMTRQFADDKYSPEVAQCVFEGVIERLGAAQVLDLADADVVPPEVERAVLAAAADCLPGLGNA